MSKYWIFLDGGKRIRVMEWKRKAFVCLNGAKRLGAAALAAVAGGRPTSCVLSSLNSFFFFPLFRDVYVRSSPLL